MLAQGDQLDLRLLYLSQMASTRSLPNLNQNLSFILTVLPIFSVVPIGPSQCTAPSGEVGNCLPNKDCVLRGGIPAGPCGGGYGICCVCK